MNVLDRLRCYPLLSLLPRDWMEEWLASGIEEDVAVGQLILQAGVVGRWACVLLDGQVRVTRSVEEREVSLGVLKPGELFGEYALLPPHLNTATCRATQRGRVLRLPLRPLRQVLRQLPSVASKLRRWLQLHFLLNFLRERDSWGFMSATSFLSLANALQSAEYPAGVTIQTTGFADDRWFVISSGEAIQRDEQLTLRAGDAFGAAAIANLNTLPTIDTKTPLKCVWLTRDDILGQTAGHSIDALQTIYLSKARPPYSTQWVGQESAHDCGLAAFAMVMGEHGRRVSLGELRLRMSVASGPLSVLQLCQLADGLGVIAHAIRVTDSQLSLARLPVIAHLTPGHYVTIFEVNETEVIIGDPATGMVVKPRRQFNQEWSGHLICISHQASSP